jgi:hypothetical protein
MRSQLDLWALAPAGDSPPTGAERATARHHEWCIWEHEQSCFLAPSVFETVAEVESRVDAALSKLASDASTGTAVAAISPARIIRFIIVFLSLGSVGCAHGSPTPTAPCSFTNRQRFHDRA